MRVRSTGRGSLTGQQRQAAVRASTVRSRTSLTGTNQPGHVQGPGPSRVERFERGAATVGRNAVAATQTGARLGSAQAQSVESKIEAQGQLDLDGQTRGMYQRSTRRMAGAVLGRSNNPVNRVAGRMVGNRSRAVGGAVKDASVDGAQLDYEETVARLGRHGARTVKKPVQRAAGRVTWKLVKVGGKATWVATKTTASTTSTAAVAGGRLTGKAVTSSARFGRAAGRRAAAATARGARRVGAAASSAASTASRATYAATQTVTRVVVAATKAAAAAVVAAVGSSTVLPIVIGVLAAVVLLVSIVPSFTVAAGQSQQKVSSAVCSNATYELGPVEPHVQAAAELLGGMFGVDSIGGWRAGNTYDYAGHPAGLAIDVMTNDQDHGQQIADYALEHAADLGILYVIWWQQIWSPERADEGWRDMADRGSVSANHKDHVHISFTETPGSGELDQLLAEACGQVANSGAVTTEGWTRPTTSTRVSSPYGMRKHPITGIYKLHSGTDYVPGLGAAVFAAGAGTVTVTHPGWAGTLVTIDHGGGVQTRYAHMYANQVKVRTGDVVSAGDKIGVVGSAGWSTGAHLHFEVKINGAFTDPAAFLKQRGL